MFFVFSILIFSGAIVENRKPKASKVIPLGEVI